MRQYGVAGRRKTGTRLQDENVNRVLRYAPIIPMILVNGSEGIGTDWMNFSCVLSSLKVEHALRIYSVYMCLHVFTGCSWLFNVADPCQNQALAGALQYQTTIHWTSLRLGSVSAHSLST